MKVNDKKSKEEEREQKEKEKTTGPLSIVKNTGFDEVDKIDMKSMLHIN